MRAPLRIQRTREADLRDTLRKQLSSPDVHAFLEYLQIQVERHQRRMASADAPDVYREQGAYQALALVIKEIKQESFKQGELNHGDE